MTTGQTVEEPLSWTVTGSALVSTTSNEPFRALSKKDVPAMNQQEYKMIFLIGLFACLFGPSVNKSFYLVFVVVVNMVNIKFCTCI